jgi:hypothetical protein
MRVLIWANDAGTKVLIFFTGGRLDDLLPFVALDEGRELQFFPTLDMSDIVVRCDGSTLTGRPFGRVAASIGLDDEPLLVCVCVCARVRVCVRVIFHIFLIKCCKEKDFRQLPE